MNVSKFFKVLVVGGAAIAGGCEAEKTGGGAGGETGTSGTTGTSSSGSGTASASAGAGGTMGTGGGGGAATGGSGQGGAGGECTCTDGSPVMCNGVCCMWMFGADEPCCDKL